MISNIFLPLSEAGNISKPIYDFHHKKYPPINLQFNINLLKKTF
jgi:hypothetical protein